jgi:hypothetical protein
MTDKQCGFCADTRDEVRLVRGREAFICHPCVARAIVRSIDSPVASGHELPEADRPCSFCGKKTPPSALQVGCASAGICTACLARSYWFVSENQGLKDRRSAWKHLDERSPASLLQELFAALGPSEVVTATRVFPVYLRVDLSSALAGLMSSMSADSVRCIGLYQTYAHEALHYGRLSDPSEHVTIAPLQYDELDVGQDEPVRCPQAALWLVSGADVPYALLLSCAKDYGQVRGWRVEVAVPPGRTGDDLARSIFRTLESKLNEAATYRGKVLSLEDGHRSEGTTRQRHSASNGAGPAR